MLPGTGTVRQHVAGRNRAYLVSFSQRQNTGIDQKAKTQNHRVSNQKRRTKSHWRHSYLSPSSAFMSQAKMKPATSNERGYQR
jgi:hypothetical protein